MSSRDAGANDDAVLQETKGRRRLYFCSLTLGLEFRGLRLGFVGFGLAGNAVSGSAGQQAREKHTPIHSTLNP